MYGYIYDIFLTQKQFTKEVIRVENSLTDLGLQGHIVRLSLISNIGHAVEDLLSRGVTTIVAVGGDQLFSSLADYCEHLQQATLGFIPIGSHRLLADLFGLPNGEPACQVLSARLIHYVKLARINQKYFIHSVVTQDTRTRLGCDDQFVASATIPEAILSILNPHTQGQGATGHDPNKLTVVVTPTVKKSMFRTRLPMPSSIINVSEVTIEEPRHAPLLVDGQKIIKTPAVLAPSDRQIRVIVGKNRKL